MRARAPGKVVISGAYSVLAGAPAVVTAVDRYVLADTTREPERTTEELAAAIRLGYLSEAPWFDATALRAADEDRKLGLGSSAAIVVAALGASFLARGQPAASLAQAVFEPALRAHRLAQGGGSGIDIAASCFGGILCCTLESAQTLRVEPMNLPDRLVIELFACHRSASTRAMLDQVARLRRADPDRVQALLAPARTAATQLVGAADAEQWIRAMTAQERALDRLGAAAAIPIVTAELRALQPWAAELGGCVTPAGAGGGDLALFVGLEASSEGFRARAREVGLELLAVALGAGGVEPVDPRDVQQGETTHE